MGAKGTWTENLAGLGCREQKSAYNVKRTAALLTDAAALTKAANLSWRFTSMAKRNSKMGTLERIVQIIPATGWYANYKKDDGIPLLGWALVEIIDSQETTTEVRGTSTRGSLMIRRHFVDVCRNSSWESGVWFAEDVPGFDAYADKQRVAFESREEYKARLAKYGPTPQPGGGSGHG